MTITLATLGELLPLVKTLLPATVGGDGSVSNPTEPGDQSGGPFMFWFLIMCFTSPLWAGILFFGLARARENKAIREGRYEDAYINILGEDHRRSKIGAFIFLILLGHNK